MVFISKKEGGEGRLDQGGYSGVFRGIQGIDIYDVIQNFEEF